MPLTAFDRAICQSKRLRIVIRVPEGSGLGQKSRPRDMRFQFPPRVVNDSRGGDWEEKSAGPNAGDKIAVYKSAEPRKMTIEWKYVVGFDNWTIGGIKEELKTMRGYFRNPFLETIKDSKKAERANSPMVIDLLIWSIGGDEPMSFRMKNASIRHGQTLVGTAPDDIFPLLTEVSGEFYSWPLLGSPPAQTVPGQKEFKIDWF